MSKNKVKSKKNKKGKFVKDFDNQGEILNPDELLSQKL